MCERYWAFWGWWLAGWVGGGWQVGWVVGGGEGGVDGGRGSRRAFESLLQSGAQRITRGENSFNFSSKSVQNQFKIGSKSQPIPNRFRTDFEPISNRTTDFEPISNRNRTEIEPNNRFRTDFEPNLNRFRTDFEPKSNRFRTEPEPMSKRGGGLVANFPGTTCTALWGPAQVGWLMFSGTGVPPTWVHRNLRATLWLRGGGGWDALLLFGPFSGSLVGERLEDQVEVILRRAGVKCSKGRNTLAG